MPQLRRRRPRMVFLKTWTLRTRALALVVWKLRGRCCVKHCSPRSGTPCATRDHSGVGSGGLQVQDHLQEAYCRAPPWSLCPLHRKTKQTKRTKALNIGEDSDEARERCLAMIQHWLVSGPSFATAEQHAAFNPRRHETVRADPLGSLGRY